MRRVLAGLSAIALAAAMACGGGDDASTTAGGDSTTNTAAVDSTGSGSAAPPAGAGGGQAPPGTGSTTVTGAPVTTGPEPTTGEVYTSLEFGGTAEAAEFGPYYLQGSYTFALRNSWCEGVAMYLQRVDRQAPDVELVRVLFAKPDDTRLGYPGYIDGTYVITVDASRYRPAGTDECTWLMQGYRTAAQPPPPMPGDPTS